MEKPLFPAAETVLRDLVALTPILYEAAEVGTAEVRDYFGSRGAPINVHLAPALFRYAAKEYLLRAGRDVEEEEAEGEEDFTLDNLSQNGLLLTYEPYRIRILKFDPRSDAGGLPSPGISAAKRAYYRQGMLPFQEAGTSEIAWVNLVVLWAATPAYDLDGDLVLVAPRGSEKQKAVIYWEEPILRPVKIEIRAEDTATDDSAESAAGDLDEMSQLTETVEGTDTETEGDTDPATDETDDN